MRGVYPTLLVGAALVLAGCVPTEFQDLRAEASTYAYEPPADYPSSGFGEQVTAYGGTLDGVEVSRMGGNAGAETPFIVYPILQGDEVTLDPPRLDGCSGTFVCEEGAGATLFGLPRWGERELCLAIPSPTTGEIRFRCEDDVSMTPPAVRGPGGQGLGEASAGLADHPFARAVLGAPGGAGGVYRLPDGAPPVRIDLTVAEGVGRGLGRAVAVAPLDADSVVIAAGAPVGDLKRVVVAVADIDPMGVVSTEVRGCLDAPHAGWGGAVAIGDLDGDGAPDIVVGSGDGEGRLDAVRVFSGADMPASETCDGSWAHAVELGCPDDVAGIECAARFGVSLTVGDLDADGQDELLVGAPDARVDGEDAAGAVFVFGGGALADSSSRTSVLVHPTPMLGANLGAALAMAPGLDGRHEPIVGAPGAERVYVFLCSGLDGDTEASTAQIRCQPR